MGMDITQLKTVIHVSELGSLSKAADRLNIAQPALSRHVRMLEAELGVQLFTRHGRGMIATEAGQEIVRHAHRVLWELEELRSSVADEAAPLRGHVSIGMPPTVADLLSVPLANAFKKHHPEATLRIVSAYSAYLLDWLQRGSIDVAILFETRRPPASLQTALLLEEELHLIGSTDDGLSPEKPVILASLGRCELLLPSCGHGLRTILEDCAATAGIQLNVRVEADSFSTLKNLVKSRNGMTVLPLAPIHQEITEKQLTHAPLVNPVPLRRLMMCCPADRPVPRLARFAGQTMASTASDLVRQGIWSGRVLVEEGASDIGWMAQGR